MHSETNILDFIDYDCVANDITAAFLQSPLSAVDMKAASEQART